MTRTGSFRLGRSGAVGWGLGDQAISSLTNFGLGMLTARSVTTYEFGQFTLAFTGYLVLLGISRSLATDSLIVRLGQSELDNWSTAVAGASGTALTIGGVSGAIVVAVGLVIGGPLGETFVASGVVLPGLLVQDAYRSAFFARRTGQHAFWNDLLWALLMFFFIYVASGTPKSPAFYLFAWGGAATIAAIVGWLQSRVLPHPTSAFAWVQRHKDLGGRYAAEFLMGILGSHVATVSVGAVAGLRAAGALRGSQILMGAVNILYQGASLAITPRAVLWARRDTKVLGQRTVLLGLGMAGGAIGWILVLLALPSDAGTFLMGENWDSSRSVLVPTGSAVCASGLIAGAVIGLRAMGGASYSLVAQGLASLVSVSLAILGAAFADAVGAAWGLAAANCIGVFIWWRQFGKARDRSPEIAL